MWACAAKWESNQEFHLQKCCPDISSAPQRKLHLIFPSSFFAAAATTRARKKHQATGLPKLALPRSAPVSGLSGAPAGRALVPFSCLPLVSTTAWSKDWRWGFRIRAPIRRTSLQVFLQRVLRLPKFWCEDSQKAQETFFTDPLETLPKSIFYFQLWALVQNLFETRPWLRAWMKWSVPVDEWVVTNAARIAWTVALCSRTCVALIDVEIMGQW